MSSIPNKSPHAGLHGLHHDSRRHAQRSERADALRPIHITRFESGFRGARAQQAPLHLQGPAPAPPAVKTSQASFTEKLKELVSADLQSAYGREATQADFDYWVPKMAADPLNLDYWHKRLLGWQAGGSDVAKAGPYAGGGGPHEPVSSVTEVVGPITPPSTPFEDSLRRIISTDLKAAYGREAIDADFAYWMPKMAADPENLEYWHRRLLGWQATGADAAPFGPYRGGVGPQGPVTPVGELQRE